MRASKMLMIVLLCLAPFTARAQVSKWRFSSLSVGAGENPITSGIGIVGGFSDTSSKRFAELAFQNEQAFGTYGTKFNFDSVSGHIAVTVGHFQGAPWVGPRFGLHVPVADQISVDLFEWPAFFAWKPTSFKERTVNEPMIGQYGSVGMNFAELSFSLGIQKFLSNNLNLLPGISYNTKIASDFSMTAVGTYNSNASRWMFFLGATWSVPKGAAMVSQTVTAK